MLDSSRLVKAETIFRALVEMPAGRRSSALVEHCGADCELSELVQRLLRHDESGMGEFLRAPAGLTSTRADESIPAPARIGDFDVIRRLSEGGMGVVYEARQANPRRNVALKVIRGGRFVDRYSIKLFQREVQALARLRHPGIGAIYEAGQTDDGQHFFAMEFVDGRPLMEHVRQARLNQRQRLELFCRICDAMHYAHQRGVMHRDLKPSNILVDADGNPRILDFGLARITDAELGAEVSRTAAGRIQGTLPYMSPEQARGESNEIDIRSDVYSLGVILYELITDQSPYDLTDLPLPRAVETICTEPPRTSADLRGDPETIARKALEKQPQRRYASAAALGEDVHRFLTNQPIEARRDSAWYVLGKTLSRHRMAASVTLAFVVLVGGAAVALAVLYQRQSRARQAEAAQRVRAEEGERRAETEAEKAVRERDKAEAFAKFMEETLKGVGPAVSRGRDTKMLKELMDAAAKRIEAGELRTAPAADLRLREAIGQVYVSIAEFDAAKRMQDPMIELAAAAHGADSAEYAKALEMNANRMLAIGRYADGLARAEEALPINRRLYPGDHQRVAANLDRIGVLLASLGRFNEALPKQEEALAIYRRLYPGDHASTAQTLENIAGSLLRSGSAAEALPRSEEAVAIDRRLFPDDHPQLANALNTLAYNLGATGRTAEALTQFEESLAMNRRLHPGDHPNVAVGLSNIGNMLIQLGRTADAIPRYEEALAMNRRLFPGDHPNVAESLGQVGSGFQYMGRSAEALSKYEEALAMFQRLFPRDHPGVARCLSSVGTALRSLNRGADALPRHEEALAMYQRLFPKGHPDVALSLSHIANDLQSAGRSSEALPKHEEALAIYQRLYPGDHADVANAMNNAASGLQAVGRLPEALARCEEGLAMAQRVHPPGHPDLRGAEIRRGSILADLERFAEAEAILSPIWKDIADRPDARMRNKVQCLQALVKVFEALDAADPDKGYDAKAAEYRLLLKAAGP